MAQIQMDGWGRMYTNQFITQKTDNRPLAPEILTAAGWRKNVSRDLPYKQQFRKEGERFNEYCADVAFLVFEKNKVSFYYYDDTTDQKNRYSYPEKYHRR